MNYPFPTRLPYTPAQLQNQFGIVSDELNPDAALHYKLAIPLNWGQVSSTHQPVTPQSPFQLQGHFKTRSGPEASVRVYVVYVAEEIAPSDWLAIYLDSQREQVLHQRHTKHKGGHVPDVLSCSAAESGAAGTPKRISRWTVLKDWAKTGGAHFFVLQASTNETDYTTEMADVFLATLAHFDLLHASEWPYAEQLQTLVRPEPISFMTAFPRSWQQLENPLGNKQFYQVQLTKTLREVPVGRVCLAIITQQVEPDMRRIPGLFDAFYQQEGLLFDAVRFQSIAPFGGMQPVWYGTTRQTNATDQPQHWREMVIGQVGTVWVYAEQLSFIREASPESWAVGKRAFEIVLDHLVTNL